MLLTLLLLASGPLREGLALYATGETASANARLIRSDTVDQPDGNSEHPDLLHIELDSVGKSRLDAGKAPAAAGSLAARDRAKEAGAPMVTNGGFEEGSTTKNYQYSNYFPGWSKVGNTAYIKSDGAAFKMKANKGDYLIGLAGKGSGVYQTVSGHVPGQWYRLMFYSSYRTTHAEGKLKVSIDAKEKMNEPVNAGALAWYQVDYKAPYADVVIAFDHEGPDENYASTIYLDSVDIKPVTLWDIKNGNSQMVLLQKVKCAGYPAEETCDHAKFLVSGDYKTEGATSVFEREVADETAVWVAIHKDGRWSFKSTALTQASPDGVGPKRSGTMWYLHADYTSCEARNWMSTPTSTFHIEANSMGYYEMSDVGTECGSLFYIQRLSRTQDV